METKLKVQGMTCEMCVHHVTNALQNLNGVQSAHVNLQTGEALVKHAGTSTDAMIEAIRDDGYDAELIP